MNDDIEPEIVHPETGEIMNGDREPGKPPDSPRPELRGTELDNALHAIVSELPVWITTDAEAAVTEKRKQKYATMKAVMSAVRPIALKHNVRIRQGCEHAWSFDAGGAKGRAVPVFTELRHTPTGQFERTTVEIPMTRMDAQAMGSAISYGRRYSLLAALSLTTDEAEDDGSRTKGRDVADDHEESQELWLLKSEINACETMEALSKLRDKAKSNGRLDKLSDADFALSQKAFKDRKFKIEAEQDGKAAKK